MKCWWTMLIPRAMASVGPRMSTGWPSMQDLALVGHGEPVQDVHQGRFAGAVLAEQRVDLAGREVEIDRVVGEDARISLGDPAHLERAVTSVMLPPGSTAASAGERTGRRNAGPSTVQGRPASCCSLLVAGGRLARVDRASLHAGEGRVDLGLDLRA